MGAGRFLCERKPGMAVQGCFRSNFIIGSFFISIFVLSLVVAGFAAEQSKPSSQGRCGNGAWYALADQEIRESESRLHKPDERKTIRDNAGIEAVILI